MTTATITLDPSGPAARIAALDGVRGLAIFLVLVFHAATGAGGEVSGGFEKIYSGVVRSGWCGVDLFFVLSGFLITGVLLSAKGGVGFFRTFYLRRVFRIFPLYYAAMIVVTAAALLPLRGEPLAAYWRNQGWYWLYAQNWFVVLQGKWPAPQFLSHLWSLAIEEQFYLFWPLVVFLLGRKGILAACAVLFLGSLGARCAMLAAGSSPVSVYAATTSRLDGLAIGGALAVLLLGPAPGPWLARAARWAGPICLAGLVAMAFWRGGLSEYDPAVQTGGFSLLAVLFASLVYAAARGGARTGVFAWAPLCYMGRVSYGMYLVHFPISVTMLRFWPRALAGHLVVSHLLYLTVLLGASLAVAAISWRYFEGFFLRLRDRVAASGAGERKAPGPGCRQCSRPAS